MNEQKRKLAELVGCGDIAHARLEKAARNLGLVEEVCAMVAQRHALRAEVVRTAPPPFRHYRHVVMARAHAANVLHDAGFRYAEIGRALCMDRTSAKRAVLRWRDHAGGRLETASEDQAHAVRDLMTAGMSMAGACAQVGIGVTRFQSREIIMRGQGKL